MKCKICSHEQKDEINALIARIGDGEVSFRSIALQFGNKFSHTSVQRHSEDCLGLTLTILRKQNLVRQAINFDAELGNILEKAKKLVRAGDRYLTDPDNPDEYSLEPRASDVMIVYFDYDDLDRNNNPKKKKASLDYLLKRVQYCEVESLRNLITRIQLLDDFTTIEELKDECARMAGEYLSVQSISIKQQDRADVLLKSIQQICNQLTLHGNAAGIFKAPQQNEVDAITRDLKYKIEQRAREKNIPFADELKFYLDNYSDNIKPEIRQQLASELEM